MNDPIKPTQAARDAAADYCQSGSDDGHTFNAMRTGECDNHPLVQAFAAHEFVAEAKIVAWLRNRVHTWRNAAKIQAKRAGNLVVGYEDAADAIERGDWKDADDD